MTFGNPIESFNRMSVVNKTDMKESKNDHRNKSPIKSKRQIEKVKLSENRKLLNLRIDDSSAETTTFKFDYIISILDFIIQKFSLIQITSCNQILISYN